MLTAIDETLCGPEVEINNNTTVRGVCLETVVGLCACSVPQQCPVFTTDCYSDVPTLFFCCCYRLIPPPDECFSQNQQPKQVTDKSARETTQTSIVTIDN